MSSEILSGELFMSKQVDLVTPREHLFVPVTLEGCEVYCGDDEDYDAYVGDYGHEDFD